MSQVLTDGNDYLPIINQTVVYGLDGNDVFISGMVGPDLYGGEGSDFIGANGTTDADIYGGSGSDTIHGGTIADQLYGDDGNDLIVGGEFDYALSETGTIMPFAGELSGNDYLDGGEGVDALYGFEGNDVLYGGDGNDAGSISVKSWSSATSFANATAGLFGGAGNDFLDGGRGNDNLYGGADNDRMLGGEGNDLLDGGTGSDVMSGGGDSDTYIVDSLGDIVHESNEGGIDTIYASVDYTLGAFQDNLFLFGVSTYATGNAGDNYITGNAGNNIINGQGGLDHLAGGAGSDIFQMVGNWGVQIISDFVAGVGTQDAVAFASPYLKSFADVLTHSEQIGGDTYIGDGQGDLVVLVGVNRSSLSADDFGFFS